jgi:hypothetical protein
MSRTDRGFSPRVCDVGQGDDCSVSIGRRVHHVWGANYQRLVTAKRRYDPDNIFRLNHNIDPSA